jgi:hypothetical protein
MINIPYHLARTEGRITRELYRAALPSIVRRKIESPRKVDIDVFAYSGQATLPEQVASVRSFLRYAGRPKSYTVVSDGTYTPRDIQWLEQIDPVVRVKQSVIPAATITSEKLRSYLTAHPIGKQLALVMSLPLNGPALYVDSDVLFFPGASDLADLVAIRNAPACYLTDCVFAGDDALICDPSERRSPVNAGLLLVFEKLDWNLGLTRLLESKKPPNFFTTQTVVQLTIHSNRARPFDPQKYILLVDDEFCYRDFHASDSVAMRHYVNPIRHKFWTYFAR